MDNDKKNPFSDEVELTDPDSLYTGSGSQMFSNEVTNRKTKKVTEQEAKIAQQRTELMSVGKDILAKIAEMRAAKTDIASYLDEIYAVNGKPIVNEVDVRVEFRARQMALADLREIERWINQRLRKSQ